MIVLSKHIEALLLKHNCVVIPKLGGFIAQELPARYDEEEEMFLPPSRSVSFNSMLAINDGLLIERYIAQENLSYADASRLLATHVTQMKDRVALEGAVELIGIGTLTSNGENGYNFTPREGGLLTPSLYGLEATTTSVLPSRQETVDAVCDEEDNSESESYTIRLNRNVVNYLAAAVMAIMFYFLTVPVGLTADGEVVQSAGVIPTKVEHRTRVQKNIVVYRRHVAAMPQAEADLEKEKIAPGDKAQEATNEYVIVMASAVGKVQAENFAQRLQAEGKISARVLESPTMRRVVIGHFATEKEAYDYLHGMNASGGYPDCWVMHAVS